MNHACCCCWGVLQCGVKRRVKVDRGRRKMWSDRRFSRERVRTTRFMGKWSSVGGNRLLFKVICDCGMQCFVVRRIDGGNITCWQKICSQYARLTQSMGRYSLMPGCRMIGYAIMGNIPYCLNSYAWQHSSFLLTFWAIGWSGQCCEHITHLIHMRCEWVW